MGVDTGASGPEGISRATPEEPRRWLRFGARASLVRVGWANLVANILIVVTGGAVRLTGSGLGCPTWPHCSGSSFVPHGAMGIHAAIEFGNRTLTSMVSATAVAVLIAAWMSNRSELRKLGIAVLASIPAQIVLGGITVLTHLNPWVVGLHFVLSMIIVGLSVLFIWRIDRPILRPTNLGWVQFAAAAVVLYLGTVVTGAGPHAGDEKAHRNGLSALQTAQLHTDFVFLLVGITVALVILRRSQAAMALLTAEFFNGAIGFTQYFTHLPIGLVGLHMFGAALVAAASTWVLLDSAVSD